MQAESGLKPRFSSSKKYASATGVFLKCEQKTRLNRTTVLPLALFNFNFIVVKHTQHKIYLFNHFYVYSSTVH